MRSFGMLLLRPEQSHAVTVPPAYCARGSGGFADLGKLENGEVTGTLAAFVASRNPPSQLKSSFLCTLEIGNCAEFSDTVVLKVGTAK